MLMDKGIIICVEVEAATRTNLSFTMFRHVTSVCTSSMPHYYFPCPLLTRPQSHLFLHHILLFHLANAQAKEAVTFASHYQHLVYFAHALEILLHTVVEEDAEAVEAAEKSEDSKERGLLPATIEFLDHFDDALDVVVGCARKIEMTRWPRLFDIVGNPKILFEVCSPPTSESFQYAYASTTVLLGLGEAQDRGLVPVGPTRTGATRRHERRCDTAAPERRRGTRLATVQRNIALLALY